MAAEPAPLERIWRAPGLLPGALSFHELTSPCPARGQALHHVVHPESQPLLSGLQAGDPAVLGPATHRLGVDPQLSGHLLGGHEPVGDPRPGLDARCLGDAFHGAGLLGPGCGRLRAAGKVHGRTEGRIGETRTRIGRVSEWFCKFLRGRFGVAGLGRVEQAVIGRDKRGPERRGVHEARREAKPVIRETVPNGATVIPENGYMCAVSRVTRISHGCLEQRPGVASLQAAPPFMPVMPVPAQPVHDARARSGFPRSRRRPPAVVLQRDRCPPRRDPLPDRPSVPLTRRKFPT